MTDESIFCLHPLFLREVAFHSLCCFALSFAKAKILLPSSHRKNRPNFSLHAAHVILTSSPVSALANRLRYRFARQTELIRFLCFHPERKECAHIYLRRGDETDSAITGGGFGRNGELCRAGRSSLVISTVRQVSFRSASMPHHCSGLAPTSLLFCAVFAKLGTMTARVGNTWKYGTTEQLITPHPVLAQRSVTSASRGTDAPQCSLVSDRVGGASNSTRVCTFQNFTACRLKSGTSASTAPSLFSYRARNSTSPVFFFKFIMLTAKVTSLTASTKPFVPIDRSEAKVKPLADFGLSSVL